MAKFTPGLMGVKTTANLGADPIGGFVDKGANQLNSAIQGNIAQGARNKATKFQQAQNMRDGIVSGHFSEGMVTQVEEALDRMSKLNPNGRNYSKVLNEAQAELGMTVQKQAKVTALLDRTKSAFDTDEDNKYFQKDEFFALLEDNTDLELDANQMKAAYQGFLKNTENINQDLVREDFVELLGKYKFGGSTASSEGEVGGLATLKQGEYSGERTQMYKLDNGISVPVFASASDVPEDLVEKWGTSSKAHMAMMDSYVNKKTSGEKYPDDNAREAAELAAGQEFVLEQMKQVIPDYASVSKTRENFQPGQGSGSGNQNESNKASLIATQLSRSLLGDSSIIGETPISSMIYGNETLEGFDITDQFKNIKLIPGIGKSPGYAATKIFRSKDEDALYIAGGDGKIKRYGEDDFNNLMILASSAGNGFTMDDANSLPEYNTSQKAFQIRQQVTDGTTTKNISDLTPAEAQSGAWSAAGNSLAGTKYKKYSMSDVNASKIRGQQKTAGTALSTIDNFEFTQMNNSNQNYDLVKKMSSALNTAWAGQVVSNIDPTKTIKSIQRGAMGGSGRDMFVVRFNDGSDKTIDQDTMRQKLEGQF